MNIDPLKIDSPEVMAKVLEETLKKLSSPNALERENAVTLSTDLQNHPMYIDGIFIFFVNSQSKQSMLLLKSLVEKVKTLSVEKSIELMRKIITLISMPAVPWTTKRDLQDLIYVMISGQWPEDIKRRTDLADLLRLQLNDNEASFKDLNILDSFAICLQVLFKSLTVPNQQLQMNQDFSGKFMEFYNSILQMHVISLASPDEGSIRVIQTLTSYLKTLKAITKIFLRTAFKPQADPIFNKIMEICFDVLTAKCGQLSLQNVWDQKTPLAEAFGCLIKTAMGLTVQAMRLPSISSKEDTVGEGQLKANGLIKIILSPILFTAFKQNQKEGKKFANYGLEFLSQSIKNLAYFASFADRKDELLFDCVMPFVVDYSDETSKLNDNPQDFVNYMFGMSKDMHKMETSKSFALQVMVIGIKKIDGFLSFLFNSITSICFTISQNQQLEQTYRTFGSCSNDLQKVESCLTILSTIRDDLNSREDLANLFSSFIKKIGVIYSSQGSPEIVKMRFMHLVYRYWKTLFSGESENQSRSDILRWMIDESSGKSALAITAQVALSELLREKDNNTYFNMLSPQLAQFFINCLEQHNPISILNFLLTFCQNQVTFLSENPAVVEQIINRIVDHILKIQSIDPESRDFDNYTKILAVIYYTEDIVTSCYTILEKELYRLVIAVSQNITRYNEDVVECTIGLIKYSGKLPSFANELIKFSIFIQENTEGKISIFLPMLTKLMTRFPDFFEGEMFDNLVKIIMRAFESDLKIIYHSEALIIVQVFVQCFHRKISEDLLKKLFDIFLNIYQGNYKDKMNSIMMDNILGAFFTLFTYFPKQIYFLLETTSEKEQNQSINFHSIFLYIIENLSFFTIFYNKKLLNVFFIAVINWAIEINQLDYVVQSLNVIVLLAKSQEILPLVVYLYRKQKYASSGVDYKRYHEIYTNIVNHLNIDNTLYKTMVNEMDDPDYDQEYFDADYEDPHQHEKEITLQEVEAPILLTDEFETLRQIMENAEITYPGFFGIIKGKLSALAQDHFSEVVKTFKYIRETRTGLLSNVLRSVYQIKTS